LHGLLVNLVLFRLVGKVADRHVGKLPGHHAGKLPEHPLARRKDVRHLDVPLEAHKISLLLRASIPTSSCNSSELSLRMRSFHLISWILTAVLAVIVVARKEKDLGELSLVSLLDGGMLSLLLNELAPPGSQLPVVVDPPANAAHSIQLPSSQEPASMSRIFLMI
jgi:hypothetical protein